MKRQVSIKEPDGAQAPIKEPDKKQPPILEPTELKVGPVSIKGQLPYVACIVLGLLVGGVSVLVMVFQYRQPSFWIDTLINPAVSATMTAQPVATPAPTPILPPLLKMIDISTHLPISLAPDHYKLNPGQEVEIYVTPVREGKDYQWVLQPMEDFPFPIQTGDHAILSVPEKQNAIAVIVVTEFDKNRKETWKETIIIRATTDARR